jgi:3-oxoacyl-[acyl-carrier protein] reductase
LDHHCRRPNSKKKAGHGHGSSVILISASLTSLLVIQGDHFVYSATRCTLEQMTRVLAKDKDFGTMGITVNIIASGPVDADNFRQGLDDDHIQFF